MGIGEGTEELTGGLVVVVPYLVQFLPRPPDNDGVLYSVVSSRLFALIAFVGSESREGVDEHGCQMATAKF